MMKQHSIIFWNLQRLFGSQGSPIEHALSGTALTSTGTSEADVEEKISVIAAVLDRIAALAGPPLIVGFAEIETAEIAEAIARKVTKASLSAVDVITKDETGFALDGLNISMLVDDAKVSAISRLRSHVIDRTFITRDILECDLKLGSQKQVSVLVNHWPSRLISEAAGQRINAALYGRRLIASKVRYTMREMWDAARQLLSVPRLTDLKNRASTPVVVMGDFNDEMFSDSIGLLGSTNNVSVVRNDLKVKGRTKKDRFRSYTRSAPYVLNPFWAFAGRGGSYYRSPRWRCYDQIMLSRGCLLPSSPLRYITDSAAIFTEKQVVRPDGTVSPLTNRNGKPIPFDPEKKRGCSDHFPVFLSVET